MPEEITGGSDPKRKLRVYVATFGCQMNEYDSEVAAGLLQAAGFEMVDDGQLLTPSSPQRGEGKGQGDVDVVLMNTCSVREHAEERVYGRLGMLGKMKRERPELVVGLMGCMVEEHREKLFKRFPQLDFLVGTRNIKELPSLIEEVRATRQKVSRIKQEGFSIEYSDLIQRASKFHAWLPIMTGCDKVCTFCMVPITRGREVSMPAGEVYREASRLVSEGVKWITLLGQNVNSYSGRPPISMIGGRNHLSNSTFERADVNSYRGSVRHPEAAESGRRIPDGDPSLGHVLRGLTQDDEVHFPDLLETLCQISGLERISFTTSHPSDATEELFQVIARNPKISRRFHLPLQSGSDRILKRMKRLHTYADYKRKIDRLRELVPDISITTDIIAGFSGETEEDFEATKRALEEIRYDGAYLYKYSVRQSTPAAKLEDDVPQEIKERRNGELLALQKEITAGNHRRWLGKSAELFVEAGSSKQENYLLGRTLQEKKVVFEAPRELIGTFQTVQILELHHETFQGRLGCAVAPS